MPTQRKKSRSEILNEQLDPFQRDDTPRDDGDEPVVESFDADADVRPAARATKTSGRLLRRGPLDESLTTGKYATRKRTAPEEEENDPEVEGSASDADLADADDFNAADVEAQMDDLFAMFEDDEDPSIDAVEDADEYEALLRRQLAENRKIRRAKRNRGGDEQQSADASAENFAHLDAGDADIMRQIQQLRATQTMKVTEEVDESVAALLEEETRVARSCVAVMAQLLSLRMKLQPAITKSIQLPQYYVAPGLERQSKDLATRYATVRTKAAQLTRDVMDAAGIATSASDTTPKLWAKLEAFHSATMRTVERGVERWGHRAAMASDPKLQAVNRPLLEQIRGVIAGRQRLLSRAQRNRAHLKILAHPHHFRKGPADRAVAIAEGDEDREIFDDGDFIKELALQQGVVASAVEAFMPKDESKSEAKKGQHRRTKGRTLNYDPHPKLVGFLLPIPMEPSSKREALLASLFGQS